MSHSWRGDVSSLCGREGRPAAIAGQNKGGARKRQAATTARQAAAAVLSLLCASTVWAQERISVQSVLAIPGAVVAVDIAYTAGGLDPAVGLQATLSLPDGLTALPGSDGDVDCIGRPGDTPVYASVQGNALKLLAVYFDSAMTPLPNGIVATCRFAVSTDAAPGTFLPILCSDAMTALPCPDSCDTTQGTPSRTPPCTAGGVLIPPDGTTVPGDMDGDGRVTIADVVMAVRAVLAAP